MTESLRYLFNRLGWWFARHWLLAVTTLLFLYVSLPYVAPTLMALGQTTASKIIYFAYALTCHQLPERSFFVFGHQVAVCHRCTAIWMGILLGGFIFVLARRSLKPIPFQWLVIALIPMGLDGGTALISEISQVVPTWIMTVFAAGVWVVLTGIFYAAGVRQWQYYLFILCFPLGMLIVHLTGPRMSNVFLRVLTGGLFGLAYAWLLFPVLQDSFKDLDSKPRPAGDYVV